LASLAAGVAPNWAFFVGLCAWQDAGASAHSSWTVPADDGCQAWTESRQPGRAPAALQTAAAGVVIFTTVDLAEYVFAGLRSGASGFRHGVPPVVAQTHGYALSFRVGAVVLAAAGLFVVVLLEHVTAKPRIAVAEVPGAGSISPS